MTRDYLIVGGGAEHVQLLAQQVEPLCGREEVNASVKPDKIGLIVAVEWLLRFSFKLTILN